MENELITYKQAAEFLHLSVNTLRNYVCLSKVPFFRSETGRVYFDPAELREWMRHERVETKASVEAKAQAELLKTNR